MKILIADDDQASRHLLEITLSAAGYEVQSTSDGEAAWRALQMPDAPPLAVLDWNMPRMSGVEVCRNVRTLQRSLYIIMLTANDDRDKVVEGLTAGADDYVTKPFNRDELRARIRTGERISTLQQALAGRVAELEVALAKVKRLQGLLPLCAWCKQIRDDQGYWLDLEQYIVGHSDATFTHGICPQCLQTQRDEIKTYLEKHRRLS